MLFEGWGPQFQPPPWRAGSHPFHRGNNVNGLSPDRNRDGKVLEIYTLRSPRARRFQEAYVRKVIDAVRGFDNVLYEIANESGSFSIPWQYHMIRFVKRYEARRGGLRHPVGMSYVQITQADPVEGGASTTLRPPFAGAAVAYLRRR